MKEFIAKKLDVRRLTAVALGVFLLAVPTVFTVYPALAQSRSAIRLGLMILWALVAVALSWVTVKRDDQISKLTAAKRDRIRQARLLAFRRTLAIICRPGAFGMPANCEVTVYMPDDNDNLTPVYPRWNSYENGPDPRVFRPGTGATGTAWEDEGLMTVRKAAVSDGHYDLSTTQQKYFNKFQSVAATVVFDAYDEKVGVVTVLSEDDNAPILDDEACQALLGELATVLGVLMTEVYPAD